MWEAYVGFTLFAIAFTLWRYRDPLHPCMLWFMTMVAHLMGDYILMPGRSDVLAYLPEHLTERYRLLVLLLVGGIWVVSLMALHPQRRTGYSTQAIPAGSARILAVAAMTLAAATYAIILPLVGFNLEAFIQSLAASRGEKAWSVDGWVVTHPLMHLVHIFYTVAAALAGYAIVINRGSWRFLAFGAFVATMPLVVTNGSRTLSFVVGGLIAAAAVRHLRGPARLGTLVSVCIATILAVLIQQNTRAFGLASFPDQPGAVFQPNLHFDDTHSRLLQVIYLVDEHGKRWDPWQFFSQFVLNFVPRWFWPERPVLDQAFYGEIKLDYVTISVLGDLIACFGVTGGIVGFLAFALIAVSIMRYAYRQMERPLGDIIYLMLAFYIYSGTRAFHGLVAFFYIPFLAIGVALVARRVESMMAAAQRGPTAEQQRWPSRLAAPAPRPYTSATR